MLLIIVIQQLWNIIVVVGVASICKYSSNDPPNNTKSNKLSKETVNCTVQRLRCITDYRCNIFQSVFRITIDIRILKYSCTIYNISSLSQTLFS